MKSPLFRFLFTLIVSLPCRGHAAPSAPGPVPSRPNLIFIMTDDQAAWGVGAYGNREIVTPQIDRLAREGVLLRNAFVPTPVCSASRATFLTGRYGTQLGITDYIATSEEEAGIGLPVGQPTWPGLLQRAGYRTGLVGKWHVGIKPQFHPAKRGFDHFFGFVGGFNSPMDPKLEEDGVVKQFKGPIADILTDDAMRFVEDNRTRPFALLVHYREPHLKYGPMPEEDNAVYRDRKLTVPAYPGCDPAEVEEMTRGYYTAIHAVDRNVGRLMARLDELHLASNTIVVFTSDHGYMIGQHGLHTKGNAWWMVQGIPPNTKRPNMYEYSIRIPFIVRWPGVIAPGTETTAPFSSIDTLATMLGILGVPLPRDLRQEGKDYSPLLRGEKIAWREVTFGQYDLHSGGLAHLRMARTERWKLVRHYLSLELDELYDLRNDPEELDNLYRLRHASAHATISEIRAARDQLQDQLYAWQRSIDDPLLALMATERDPAQR